MKTYNPIPSHPNYEISVKGTIRKIQTKAIKSQYIGSTGYYMVTFVYNRKSKPARVHRLIAEVYIPNPNKLPEINHKNGIKTDNRLRNMEWCTRLDNARHAFKTGLINNTGERNGKSKLKLAEVRQIKRLLKTGLSQEKIAAMFPVTRSTILGIKLGRLWHHVK
jgi:hypothetical protein